MTTTRNSRSWSPPPALRILFVALLAVCGADSVFAGVGQWTTAGPDGASVNAFASHPSAASTVYVATPRRVYKSVDAGEHWTPTGLATSVYRVVPTSDPSVVYAVGSISPTFHRSRDGGETWESSFALGGAISAIAVEPRNPSVLYAASASRIYRSTNGGDDWERLEGTPQAAFFSAVAVDASNSNVLYAAVNNVPQPVVGIYRSVDRGVTWNRTGSDNDFVWKLLPDPRGSRVYAATSGGLRVSTNRGETWQIVGPSTVSVHDIAVHPSDPNVIFLIVTGTVNRSSDGGVTRTPIPQSNLGGFIGHVSALGGSVVLAGSNRGIARSADSGRSWTAGDVGISEVSVRSLAIDPGDPAVLYAAGPQGLYRSADGGGSWSAPVPTDPSVIAVAVDPSSPSTIYAAGENGVHRSTDRGQTWQRRTPPEAAAFISELVIDPNNPRRILAGQYGIYQSLDSAESWTKILTLDDDYSSYYYPATVKSIAFAPSDGSTVYAGGQEGFVYRSSDGGDHWVDVRAGLGVNALEVDSCDPRLLHAASFFGAHRSIDGGETWGSGQLSGTEVFALARDPRHPSSVFAGTINGLFWSIDRGATWARFEPVLQEVVRSIALDPTGRHLYAGTDRGVFVLERTFEPCSAGPDRLCLVGGKFQVSIRARDPRTGASITGRAIEERDQFGYFSFPDLTGDPTFPEVFVKMADATGAPAPYGGHTWVFHSSLTDLDYTLTVLEPETGRVRTYLATDDRSLTCGAADTSAFVRACDPSEASSEAAGSTPLSASGGELSLLSGRFRATVSARDPRSGRTVVGEALSKADGFGYFSLPGFTGDPSFPEVFVKMADARALPGGWFWVFHTGLTDLEYTLTVRDSATGASKTYSGGATGGTRLCGAADTSAFHD